MMDSTVIQIGTYTLPFPAVLAKVLSIVFSMFNKSDGTNGLSERIKNGIAMLCGVGFGVIVMLRNATSPDDLSLEYVIGWILYGIFEGATTVRLYKTARIMSGK